MDGDAPPESEESSRDGASRPAEDPRGSAGLPSEGVDPREERLARLYAECSDRLNAGEKIDFHGIISQHPDLAPDLGELLASIEEFEPPPRAGLPFESLGDYEIIREVGRGGMGVVYEARQVSMDRRVALKVLSSSLLSDPRAVHRFRREARVSSQIDHPGVCPVYDADVAAGVPYIAMRFLEGESLARRIARAREARSPPAPPPAALSPSPALPESSPEGRTASGKEETSRDARVTPGSAQVLATVRLIEKVARSLHAAHEAGFLHRDVKPGNIMVTPDGDPVLLDFGLAKVEEEDETTLTRSGGFVGTPAYMSPEQVSGRRDLVDRRTDVYSLGVTLYEALTLRLPFEAPSRESLYEKILHMDPPDPRRANRRISKELKVILETALEKDVERRYRTTLDLAEELRRLQEHEPIRARPAGPALRFRRWIDRNPVLSTAALGFIFLLAVALGFTLVLLGKERAALEERGRALREKEAALVEKDRAIEEKDAALVRADGQRLLAHSSAALEGNPGLALLLAIEGARRAPGRSADKALLAALLPLRERKSFCPHTTGVFSASFSPDGKKIVTAGDFRAIVRDASSGEATLSLRGHTLWVVEAWFSPDGSRILTCAEDGTARIWDAETGEQVSLIRAHEKPVRAARFSPDGSRILTCSEDGTAKAWEAATGRELACFRGHSKQVRGGAFSPDLSRVVTASHDGTARIWDSGGTEVHILQGHGGEVNSARFSPDGSRVVTASQDRTWRIWDAASGKEVLTVRMECPILSAVHDGSRVLAACDDGTARIWDAASGREDIVLARHDLLVRSAQFSPDGRRVVTGSRDGTARIWDLEPGAVPALRGHRGEVLGAQFRADGRRAITASADGSARIWDLPAGEEVLALVGHEDKVWKACFSPDGRRAATASSDGTARIWDAADGRQLLVLRGHDGIVYDVAFSPDGSRLATAGFDDARVRLWDASDGKEILVAWWMAKSMDAVAFAPDGKTFAAASRVGEVRVIGATDGGLVRVLTKAWRPMKAAAFSPDGRLVAGATEDALGIVWEAESGKEMLVLRGHAGGLTSIGFSADGGRIVTSSHDGTARIWEFPSGKELLSLEGHGGIVYSAAFSPDGRRVLTASADGTARLWPVDPLGAALAAKPRDLAPDEVERYEIGTPEERLAYRVKLELDRRRQALDLASRALKRERVGPFARKDYRGALFDLLEALLSDGPGRDPAEAQRLARSGAEAMGVKDPAVLAALGKILALCGLHREAVPILEEAIDGVTYPGDLARVLDASRRALEPEIVSFGSVDAALDREIDVIPIGAAWRYVPGLSEPSPGLEWTLPDFDDGAWNEGPSGFGYQRGGRKDVPNPFRGEWLCSTFYLRRAFQLPDPVGAGRLILSVAADDGFVAYLSGREAGRSMAGPAGSRVPFDGASTGTSPEPTKRVDLVVDPALLRPGKNVLAIQAVNDGKMSSSFYLVPALERSPPAERARGLLERVAGGDQGAGARVAYLEGRLLILEGKDREAAERLREAVRSSPGAPEPVLRLAETLERLGAADEAREKLRQALGGDLARSRRLREAWARRLRAGEVLGFDCGWDEYGNALVWQGEIFDSGRAVVGYRDADGLTHWYSPDHPFVTALGSVYRLPVPRGEYSLSLRFAVVHLSYAGPHDVDILVQGFTVLKDFKPPPPGAAPETRTFAASAWDDALYIEFLRNHPLLSRIELTRTR